MFIKVVNEEQRDSLEIEVKKVVGQGWESIVSALIGLSICLSVADFP